MTHQPTDRPVPTLGPPLIAARGLCVTLGTRAVLQGIDVAIAAGEILTLIGPNGAGKTTLLRTLLGLLNPSAGSVERRPGLRIGYMPQRMSMDSVLPLSVRRLMTLTMGLGTIAPMTLWRARRTAAVEAALAETGVAHLVDAPVAGLSGGELQRVLLARALLRDPDLLALDEPVQGVDFPGEAALYELIGGIRNRRGCGVLMISHDLHVVMAATDRVLCMNHHVCCAGTPEAVSRHPEYARLFGSRAAAALAVYAHHHDHRHDLKGAVVGSPAAPNPGRGTS
jgi:zinc transport system ATP-binding protein